MQNSNLFYDVDKSDVYLQKINNKNARGILVTTIFIIFRLPCSTQTSKKLSLSEHTFTC